MGALFGFFRKREVAGDISALGLQEWWFDSFSDEDRSWMTNTYAPMGEGRRPLTEGNGMLSGSSPFAHLCGVATWFNSEGRQHCAIAFINKAMDYYGDEVDVLDRHFGLANQCAVMYRWRDLEVGALERAIKICELSILIHHEAAARLKKELGHVPAHACFRQLRIIEEKRGNFRRAIELCEMAKDGGWADDWDKCIDRLRKKQAKLPK